LPACAVNSGIDPPRLSACSNDKDRAVQRPAKEGKQGRFGAELGSNPRKLVEDWRVGATQCHVIHSLRSRCLDLGPDELKLLLNSLAPL
jgi:hypothetical protein